MTTITQKIPNLLGGISQQPDVKKFPGEVRKCINAFPEYALGLMKRPGSKVEAPLRGAAVPGGSVDTPSGQSAVTRYYGATEKWFDINVDGVPYVGQINDYSYTANGSKDHLSLQLWFKDSGIPRAVNLDSYMDSANQTYITSGSWANYQTQINAETAALVAKTGGLSTFQTEQKTYFTNYLNTIDVLNNIFRVDTTYNKGDVYQFVFNGVLQDDQDNISFIKDGEVMEGTMPTTQATATVSVTNTITDVGVSDGGSGYTSAPTVTIAGSGSNATATAVLSDTGDLSSINITNSGAEYIDVPTVTFGGGLSGYQGTAVVNWFTKQVTKVLVEDGDVIDLTDENERYETNGNIAKRDSLYGSGGNDSEGNRLLSDQLGFNTGRPNMTFMAGSGLTTGPLGLYLKPRDLTGKSKIRIMAVTANTRFVQGVGNVVANTTAPANGLDTIDGGNSGTYELGTHNGGLYNDFGTPFNSLGVPTLDVYIAKEGVTSLDNFGNTNPIWNNGSSVSGDPPDNSFILALPRFSSGTDWRHIGEIIPANPATNTDEPYYLSEYEFNIPADLQTTGCYICIGSSNQSPSIGQADSSRRFAVTTLTLVNAVPTTTNIADSTVTFNVNPKSANAQSLFPRWNTRDGLHPFYFDKLLTFRNGVITPTTPTTTAVADVILGKSVANLTLTNAGSGYNVGQATTISLTGGNPTVAATPTITLTPTFEPDITEPGLGYTNATATLSGGGGSGATAAVSVLDGKISHIDIIGGDSNYISDPTITISAPNLAQGTVFPRFASNDEFDEFVQQGTGDVFKIGVEKTDEYPILINAYPKGYRVWEILELDRASDPNGTALKIYETNTYDPEEIIYDNLVTAHNTAITNTDNAYPTFDITKLPLNGANNYFVDDVVGGGAKVNLSELKVVTFQDTTFILNPKKKVTYTADRTPVAKFDEGFIFFKILTSGDFEVEITLLSNDPNGNEPHEDDYVRTVDSSFATNGVLTGSSTHNSSTNTVSEHLDDLVTSFTSGYSTFSNDFDFIQSGNGIYIATKGALANRQFELVVNGPTEDSIDTLRHEVNDIAQLPIQLKEGYKIKVVNSLQVNADDFYVTFKTEESGNDFSGGIWEESNGRGIPFKIDANTMPHALTINSDGSFSFGPWPHWDERQVGDELTNPTPEFITTTGANRYIKDMFVYRNRLGFLSQDYVSLSRAGEFFNFFTKSALAGADDDPINISVSDVDTPNLAYVSKEAAGLLIFGDTGQYLLSTDSDVLAPTTAKINKVSGFKSDVNNPSLSLGGTTAFVSKTVSSTKMFELLKVSSIQPPDVIEQSRTVPELLPISIDSIVGSPDLGLVSFGTIGTTDLYHFNYLRVGDREIGSAWYQWELPGNLLHQFFDTNEYHAVIRTATNETLTVSFDVAQSSIAGVLSLESGTKTDLVLDVYDDKPLITYTGINAQGILEDKTRIYLPTGKLNDKKLVVVMYSNRSQVFDEETVTMTEQTDPIHGKYIEVDGDWRGSDVFVGYKYNMSVELPRFYFKRVQNEQINTDVDADLIIHKLKVKTGLTGPITYKVNIVGIPERSSTFTITPSGQYNLDEVNMTETGTHVVPVYQRNDNTIVTIESNTAFPATIESINWEGRYATNFYRRA